MSMIMQIARGSVADLERFAEAGSDAALPPATLAALRRRQRARFAAMTPESKAQFEAALRADPQYAALLPRLLARLHGDEADAPPDGDDAGSAATATMARPETVDLHKSWHVFHFLFTGQADAGTPPANFLLDGGREIGEDRGYGPARLFDAAQTVAIARFTAALTTETLTARIDAPRMAQLGIYCAEDGSDATARELADDVAHYFPPLQAQLQAAAAGGQALLVSLE